MENLARALAREKRDRGACSSEHEGTSARACPLAPPPFPPPGHASQLPGGLNSLRFISRGRGGVIVGSRQALVDPRQANPEQDYSAAERGPSLPCAGSTKASPRWRLRKSPGVLPVQRTNAW